MGVASTRPVGVTLIGVANYSLAALFLAGAATALALGPTVVADVEENMGIPFYRTVGTLLGLYAAGYLLAFALATAATGWGLLSGRPWAWLASLILAGMQGLGLLVLLLGGELRALLGLVVYVIVVLYLVRPEVKAYFGRAPT